MSSAVIASRPGCCFALDDVTSSQQDGGRGPGRPAYDIDAVMHAIAQVDVCAASLTEHDLRARGGPPEGMRPGILVPLVCFDLGQPDSHAVRADHATQQRRR